MVRVGGLTYAIEPGAVMGKRISDMRLNGQLIEADKTYRVAGWAPVAEQAREQGGKPVWDLVAPWLRAQKRVRQVKLNAPRLIGVGRNAGIDAA